VTTSATLAQMQSDVEFLGDFEGLIGVGLRHEPDEVTRVLNVSRQSLVSLITSCGSPFFIESTAPASLPVTPTIAGEEYVEVPWPTGADEVHAVHVKGGHMGSSWLQIESIDWSARRAVAHRRGCDLSWALRRLPTANPSDLDAELAGVIQIMPVPTGGQYVIDYIPALPFAVAPADLFVGLPDWLRWIALDATATLLGPRDGDDSGQYGPVTGEREKVEQRIRAAYAKPRSGARALPRRAPRGR
jgi:hypothetical protein